MAKTKNAGLLNEVLNSQSNAVVGKICKYITEMSHAVIANADPNIKFAVQGETNISNVLRLSTDPLVDNHYIVMQLVGDTKYIPYFVVKSHYEMNKEERKLVKLELFEQGKSNVIIKISDFSKLESHMDDIDDMITKHKLKHDSLSSSAKLFVKLYNEKFDTLTDTALGNDEHKFKVTSDGIYYVIEGRFTNRDVVMAEIKKRSEAKPSVDKNSTKDVINNIINALPEGAFDNIGTALKQESVIGGISALINALINAFNNKEDISNVVEYTIDDLIEVSTQDKTDIVSIQLLSFKNNGKYLIPTNPTYPIKATANAKAKALFPSLLEFTSPLDKKAIEKLVDSFIKSKEFIAAVDEVKEEKFTFIK